MVVQAERVDHLAAVLTQDEFGVVHVSSQVEDVFSESRCVVIAAVQ